VLSRTRFGKTIPWDECRQLLGAARGTATASGYTILDYSYEIRGETLATYHRDVTSSPYVLGTRFPVFTLIQYGFPGPHLAVCPGSHKTTPWLTSSPRVFTGRAGQWYLFHCDLVHAGALAPFATSRQGDVRVVRQYKVAHSDDAASPRFAHLRGSHTKREMPERRWHTVGAGEAVARWLRAASWLGAHFVNHWATPVLQRPSTSRWVRFASAQLGADFYAVSKEDDRAEQ